MVNQSLIAATADNGRRHPRSRTVATDPSRALNLLIIGKTGEQLPAPLPAATAGLRPVDFQCAVILKAEAINIVAESDPGGPDGTAATAPAVLQFRAWPADRLRHSSGP